MKDETIVELAKQSALSDMRLRARCDALETVLMMLAMRVGIEKATIVEALRQAEAAANLEHQVRVEDYLGPGFAADTFDQPPSP